MGGDNVLEPAEGMITQPVVTVSLTVYTIGMNYFLEPWNNPAKGKPYRRIRFSAGVMGIPQSISLQAVFGYCSQMPDDAWDAILGRSLRLMMPAISSKRSAGTARRMQGEKMEQYAVGKDAGAYAFETMMMQGDWDNSLWGYARQVAF
jgi:hypothetical protein